jgi:hypothetical protein
MSNRPTGHGHIYAASGAWHTRFYIPVKGERVSKSLRICTKNDHHPSKESVVQLATDLVTQAQAHAKNQEQTYTTGKCPTCGRFTKAGKTLC